MQALEEMLLLSLEPKRRRHHGGGESLLWGLQIFLGPIRWRRHCCLSCRPHETLWKQTWFAERCCNSVGFGSVRMCIWPPFPQSISFV